MIIGYLQEIRKPRRDLTYAELWGEEDPVRPTALTDTLLALIHEGLMIASGHVMDELRAEIRWHGGTPARDPQEMARQVRVLRGSLAPDAA